MSATIVIELCCDEPDCDNSRSCVGIGSRYALGLARRGAFSAGWSSRSSYDFCPLHTVHNDDDVLFDTL